MLLILALVITALFVWVSSSVGGEEPVEAQLKRALSGEPQIEIEFWRVCEADECTRRAVTHVYNEAEGLECWYGDGTPLCRELD